MNLRAVSLLLLLSFYPNIASANDQQTKFHPWGSHIPNSTNCFGNKTSGNFIDRFVQQSEQATPWLKICSSDTNAAAGKRLEKLKDCKEICCFVRLTREGKIEPGPILKSSENSESDEEFISILKDSPSLKYAPPNMLPFRNCLQANVKNGEISLVIVRP